MTKLKQVGIDVDVNRAIESSRRTFGESVNDILRRLLLGQAPPIVQRVPSLVPVARSRGLWTVRIDNVVSAAQNLKDAYCQFVAMLAQRDPNFMVAFASEKSRARRFVARAPQDLYINSPHLAEDHAVEILPGWFIDTNLSEDQVAKRVRIATRLAGLSYGSKTCLLRDLKEL